MAELVSGPRALLLNSRDNVAVVIQALKAGEEITVGDHRVTVTADVPFGHKVAIGEIGSGAAVVKYGEVIGLASAAISPGDHVHVHNVVSARLPGGGT